jgi:hypothetical protein
MKMTHQDAIAEVIYKLLKMPQILIEAFGRGNPFDKLLRSYSEFTSNGKPLYRNKRCIHHYPFSENAYSHYKKYNTLDGLHAEHEVPLSTIKEALIKNKSWNLLKVKSFLAENNKVVIITKDEQGLIDSKFKSIMPPYGISRLEYFQIKIAKSTSNNTLKAKNYE